MNCKNCRHWFVNPNIVIPGEPTEGKCLVSEIKTQSNQVCNAWELSRIAELEHDLSNKEIEYTDLWDDMLEMQARIAELETERRWIPVSEGLPELDQDVFAVVDGELDRGHFYQQWDGEVFFSSDEKGAMMVATHWMPLPELPEVQE